MQIFFTCLCYIGCVVWYTIIDLWWYMQNAFEHHCGCCCRLSVVQTSYTVVLMATSAMSLQEVVSSLYIPCHGMQWLWARWIECCRVMLCVLEVRTNVLMDKPAVYWIQDHMAAALILRYCIIFPIFCRGTHWFVGVLTRVVNITDYENVLLLLLLCCNCMVWFILLADVCGACKTEISLENACHTWVPERCDITGSYTDRCLPLPYHSLLRMMVTARKYCRCCICTIVTCTHLLSDPWNFFCCRSCRIQQQFYLLSNVLCDLVYCVKSVSLI